MLWQVQILRTVRRKAGRKGEQAGECGLERNGILKEEDNLAEREETEREEKREQEWVRERLCGFELEKPPVCSFQGTCSKKKMS